MGGPYVGILVCYLFVWVPWRWVLWWQGVLVDCNVFWVQFLGIGLVVVYPRSWANSIGTFCCRVQPLVVERMTFHVVLQRVVHEVGGFQVFFCFNQHFLCIINNKKIITNSLVLIHHEPTVVHVCNTKRISTKVFLFAIIRNVFKWISNWLT